MVPTKEDPDEDDRAAEVALAEARPSFTCPRCKMVTYNPYDVKYSFCGHCHAFV